MNRIFSPEFFLILAAFLWGGTFVAIKLALESVPPFFFIAIRFWIAGLAILLIYRKNLFQKGNLKRSVWFPSLLTAICVFSGYAFQTLGLVYTTATQSGFITGAYVIFVPILQILVEKKLPAFRTWIAVVVVLFGLFLISQNDSQWSGLLEQLRFSKGDLLTLASAFFFAVYIILIDIFSKKIQEKQFVSFQILFTAALATVVFPFELIFFTSEGQSLRFDSYFWMGVIYTSLFATILTTQLHTRFQKAVSPTRAGILFSLEPVFSFILAYLILGERLSSIGALGSALVLFGILLSEMGKWNQRKE
ncbi:DMT family transporter [Leptospira idonii]|uniref:DMT family transporter n=1 Tax=Leptospira idonii TaxID=1193500 RepID=A0A4V3JYD2_9LEPT|nr:DMT family transporter [Leptospira idonii]TGN20706.1 DMT family transporter [Leptospira idonii]